MAIRTLLLHSMVMLFACGGPRVAASGDSGDLVARAFERANAGDVAGVRAFKSALADTANPGLRYAYRLARYIAEPMTYAPEFVEAFPTDTSVMGVVYGIETTTGLGGKPLTPRFLYSFDELGRLAQAGQQDAPRKRFLAAANSDAAVAEFVWEQVVKVIASQPSLSITELSALRPAEREKAYGCFLSGLDRRHGYRSRGATEAIANGVRRCSASCSEHLAHDS